MLETFKVSETEEYSSKYYKTIMTTIKIYECSFIITWQKALNNNMKNIYDFQPIEIKGGRAWV
ncbi:hypothetical protein [Thomasclavelia cocleata]|uniref:hypothetical protein n=1 Tax=Thomasclavelia cocleata TaxID=69824 RepID=UPI00256EE353|nr:hypothetical protein [Thomasclavelia cocleata]